MHISELMDLNARRFPDKDFVRINGKGYTYSTIKDFSEKAAGFFKTCGIGKGDKIAIMSFNTAGFVIGFHATAKTGATLVPVNHKLTHQEVDYILEHSEAKLFLFDGALKDVADNLSCSIKKVSLESRVDGYEHFEDELEKAEPFTLQEFSDLDIAQILYTSGTTGNPKGCLHTHRSVIAAGIGMGWALKFDDDDRILMAMPIWHSSPLNNWFVGIQIVGGTMVMLREYHPLHFLQTIQEEKCTAFFGAPIALIMPVQMIPNFDEFDLSSMRVFMYGGGPIPAEVIPKLMEKYKSKNFYQCYGMTESGPTGSISYPKHQLVKLGSIGTGGAPGGDLKVMKNNDEEALPGEVGEIWLKGDSIMQEYYKDPDATANVLQDGWYKTGDVALLDEDRFLFIQDRKKDMIITGGENVYSKEVEDAIGSHPDVMEVAVIGIPHPEWGETVGAVIVPNQGADLTSEEIKSYISDKLAKYKIPRFIEFAEDLPHTPTGKIKKFELREAHSKAFN